MIYHLILMRKIPMNVFILFLLVAKFYHQADSKYIILEDEEDVIISVYVKNSYDLNVKCDYSGDFKTNSFEWKKIYNNNKWMNQKEKQLNVISRSQWLKFEKVSYLDSGQYSCSIKSTNRTGTFFEKRGFVLDTLFTVDKNSKVKFLKNFTENVPLLVNRTLHLSCPFRSSSDTEFSWYKDGNLLVKRKAILDSIDFIDNYYTSKSVRLSDAGNYKCVVKNSEGSIKFKFNVGVYEDMDKLPPSLDYPQDLLSKTGVTVQFNCNAFDYILKWQISWYYSNDTNPMDMDIKSVDFSKFKKLEDNTDVRFLILYY
uniref:Hemicentin-1 n=1 Tax=Schizaphis graminum TaxID=13262 RepID=A0A2S2P6K8_SCHGA